MSPNLFLSLSHYLFHFLSLFLPSLSHSLPISIYFIFYLSSSMTSLSLPLSVFLLLLLSLYLYLFLTLSPSLSTFSLSLLGPLSQIPLASLFLYCFSFIHSHSPVCFLLLYSLSLPPSCILPHSLHSLSVLSIPLFGSFSLSYSFSLFLCTWILFLALSSLFSLSLLFSFARSLTPVSFFLYSLLFLFLTHCPHFLF